MFHTSPLTLRRPSSPCVYTLVNVISLEMFGEVRLTQVVHPAMNGEAFDEVTGYQTDEDEDEDVSLRDLKFSQQGDDEKLSWEY